MLKSYILSALITCWSRIAMCEEAFHFDFDKPLVHGNNARAPFAAMNEYPQKPDLFFMRNQSGFKAIAQGDYQKAHSIFILSTTEFKDDGDLWRARAYCEEMLGQNSGAIRSYQKALALGVTPWDAPSPHIYNPNDIRMHIARLYASQNNITEALHWLRLSLESRFDESPSIIDDPAFVKIRGHAKFRALLTYDVDETSSRDERWRSDIHYLGNGIAALHANADHKRNAKDLTLELEKLIADVPTLEDEQILARLTAFVGSIGAGHDIFWPVSAVHGALKPFALKFYLFRDGLFIIDAYDKALIGSKVILFDDTPVSEAYNKIALAFFGDNEMQARWQSARHFAQAYTLENLGIVEDAKNVKLTVIDRKGEKKVIIPERHAFTPMTPALTNINMGTGSYKTPLYLSRMKDNFWTEEIKSINSLYVQLQNVMDTDKESLAEFAARIASMVRKEEVKYLILDLRHSPGGNGYLTPPLLRELIAFSVNPDKKNLFIIIGRNTFSASQNLITDLDWIADPIFVGEPSGSKPNAYSESGHLKLPYSGASASIASQFHQHSWPEDERHWIAPDIPVSLSSEDYFQGEDPAMDAITQFINRTH